MNEWKEGSGGRGPVVQSLDGAIHGINHYPANTYLRNWLRYPVASVIHLSNSGPRGIDGCN